MLCECPDVAVLRACWMATSPRLRDDSPACETPDVVCETPDLAVPDAGCAEFAAAAITAFESGQRQEQQYRRDFAKRTHNAQESAIPNIP